MKGTDETPEVSESGGGSLEIDGFESQLSNEQESAGSSDRGCLSSF